MELIKNTHALYRDNGPLTLHKLNYYYHYYYYYYQALFTQTQFHL